MITATITIVRSGATYQHSLIRDHVTVMSKARIDAERARQIIEANPEGQLVDGALDFGSEPASWTWQAAVEFEGV